MEGIAPLNKPKTPLCIIRSTFLNFLKIMTALRKQRGHIGSEKNTKSDTR